MRIFLLAQPTFRSNIPADFCIEGKKRGLRWAAGGLPTLHAMGFIMQVIDPLGSGQAFAVFTPTEPQPPIIPTADRVLELAKAAKCSAIPTVPTFIEVSSSLP